MQGRDAALRLLLVNTVPTDYNGQTMFLLKYLRAMDLTGVRAGLVAIAPPPRAIRDELEALGVALWVIPRNRNPLGYVLRLSRLIRAEGFQVVHVHGNSATIAVDLLAAALGGAEARVGHSHNTRSNSPALHRLLRPMMQALATDRFACGQEAGVWMWGKKPFEIIPIASDPGEYRFDPDRRAAARRNMGLGEGDIALGCVAGLVPAKNHGFLLDAFASARRRNPNLRLELIGEGALRQSVEAQIEQLGIADAVHLTGSVDDVPDRMQGLDALALPSLHEGFPNVLVEAQMAGLPALVSENVTRDCDITGLLRFLPLDAQVWEDALVDFAPNDREAASALGCRRAASRGYDVRKQAAMLRARYEEMAKKHGSEEKNERH